MLDVGREILRLIWRQGRGVLAYALVGFVSIAVAFYFASQTLGTVSSQESSDTIMPAPPPPPPGNPAGTTPAPGAAEADAPIDPNIPAESPRVDSFLEPFIYEAEGRRDPFKPPSEDTPTIGDVSGPYLPLQRYDLRDLFLIGIIWGVKEPKAMFLDPNKVVHILGKDDRIGRNNGYIAVIREGEVVVVETVEVRGELAYTTQVIKITR